jgi:hypothetical protein
MRNYYKISATESELENTEDRNKWEYNINMNPRRMSYRPNGTHPGQGLAPEPNEHSNTPSACTESREFAEKLVHYLDFK